MGLLNIKNLFFTIVLFIFTAAYSSNNDIFNFKSRKGLPNFSNKVLYSDSIRIAYLGGSITAQRGWRVSSFEYFKAKYPNKNFIQIDASMGGTGSLLGVLRLDEDILKLKPDLVFVEFAVNDAKMSLNKVTCSMEGIVRKIWKNNPYCDIIFVYTTTDKIIEQFGLEQIPNTIKQMEEIANYYDIPSVYMPFDVINMLKEGSIIMKKPKSVVAQVSGEGLNKCLNHNKARNEKVYFSQDGVHPYLDTGHVYYMNVLRDALNNILKIENRKIFHTLKKPYTEDNFERTQKIFVNELCPKGEWYNIPKESNMYQKYKNRFKEIWIGEVGATLDFTFKGRALVCYDIISEEGCRLEITVDGEKFYINRFDAFCTYDRLHFAELISNLDSQVTHHVHIKVTDVNLDKKEILKKNNNEHYIKKYPNKYNKVHWLVNSIFIIN